MYFSGQLDIPACNSSWWTIGYTADWNFGGLAPPVTDTGVSFAVLISVLDSMTPLHSVTIPSNAAPGTIYPVFYSYYYSCSSGSIFADTPSVVLLYVISADDVDVSVSPDTVYPYQQVTVSYASSFSGNAATIYYDYGDSTYTSLNTHAYSDTGVYYVAVNHSYVLCYHKQIDTVYVLPDPVSVEHSLKSIAVKIYPVPANEILNLDFTSERRRRIQVRDMAGKEIVNEIFETKSCEINVGEIEEGIYVLRIDEEEGRSHIEKLAVAHTAN